MGGDVPMGRRIGADGHKRARIDLSPFFDKQSHQVEEAVAGPEAHVPRAGGAPFVGQVVELHPVERQVDVDLQSLPEPPPQLQERGGGAALTLEEELASAECRLQIVEPRRLAVEASEEWNPTVSVRSSCECSTAACSDRRASTARRQPESRA